jgi:hypothetical protein
MNAKHESVAKWLTVTRPDTAYLSGQPDGYRLTPTPALLASKLWHDVRDNMILPLSSGIANIGKPNSYDIPASRADALDALCQYLLDAEKRGVL